MQTSLIRYLSASLLLGFATMAIEISAVRLMTPSFGSSTLVWTNVIAVVLLLLSLGYWTGGRMADKNPTSATLAKFLYLDGLLVLGAALVGLKINELLASRLEFLGLGYIFFGSLLSAVLVFGAPIFFAGMCSPYLVTLATKKNSHLGNMLGSFYAVSTLGGLLGTFIPTLISIPTIGTTKTIALCGFTLLFAGLLIHTDSLKQVTLKSTAILLLATLSITWFPVYQTTPHAIAQFESIYQRIYVEPSSTGEAHLKFDAGLGIQSTSLNTNILSGLYYDAYSLFPAIFQDKQPVKVLILGLAGGTIAKQLKYFYKDKVEITGVELDPKVIEVGKKYFELDETDITIVNQDARTFVSTTQESFDLVILDTYQNELQIPWQLTTQEFWEKVKNILNSSGLLLMNVAHLSTPSILLDSLAQTQNTVFPFVATARATYYSKFNSIVIAGNSEPDLAKLSSESALEFILQDLIQSLKPLEKKSAFHLLTDDSASTDWLLFQELQNLR